MVKADYMTRNNRSHAYDFPKDSDRGSSVFALRPLRRAAIRQVATLV
jgi:hypothetical protein